MLRPPHRLLALAAMFAVLALPAARAQQAMNLGSEYGIMVTQAVHTLGGTFVTCDSLPGAALPTSARAATAQVACARLPSDMLGYFRLGVHGRLYGYLARGTLRVARRWQTVGNHLEVVYDVQGGTLTVEREQAGSQLFAVFAFVGNPKEASSRPPGH